MTWKPNESIQRRLLSSVILSQAKMLIFRFSYFYSFFTVLFTMGIAISRIVHQSVWCCDVSTNAGNIQIIMPFNNDHKHKHVPLDRRMVCVQAFLWDQQFIGETSKCYDEQERQQKCSRRNCNTNNGMSIHISKLPNPIVQ